MKPENFKEELLAPRETFIKADSVKNVSEGAHSKKQLWVKNAHAKP